MTPTNLARHRTNPNMAFWKMLKVGNDHFEVSHLEPKVEVCDRHYVFDAAQPANSSKPLAFNPSGRCPAYVVAADIAAPALEKSHNDEAQYASLVKSNVWVAPIRTGLDGGMNRVFLSQVGGSLPPARVANSLPPQPAPPAFALDNGGSSPSMASRLFGGMFSGKPDTQVAATDAAGAEATGTAAAQKPKLQLRETIGATNSKPKPHEPRSEPSKPEEQQAAKAKPAPAPAITAPTQEANAAAPTPRPPTVNGAQSPLASGDFSNRWGGLQ
jgi:hypothetical protein